MGSLREKGVLPMEPASETTESQGEKPGTSGSDTSTPIAGTSGLGTDNTIPVPTSNVQCTSDTPLGHITGNPVNACVYGDSLQNFLQSTSQHIGRYYYYY